MANFVKVTAKEGQIVIASTNNPEFGYVRVKSEHTSMENGWIQTTERSALVRGKVADLQKANFKEGQMISGKIYIKESTTPSFEGQKAKINPTSGEIVTNNGNPIYRESFFTADLDKADELLANDTVTSTVAAPKAEAAELAKSL